MTTTDEIGIRVSLSGQRDAVGGLNEVAAAEGKLTAAANDATTAKKRNADAAREAGAAHGVMADMLTRLRTAALGALTIGALTTAIVTQAKEVYTATATFERYTRTLGFATGSQAGASAEMAYARKVGRELNLDIGSLAQGYSKLAASMQGTSLSGRDQRDIFLGIAQAGSVLGLSNEAVNSSFVAISQMIGKNVVMSEELKGQLAEHLPGALNIAARAMGKTTAELTTMLEQGTLLSSDFVPKLGRELQKTFGPDSARGAENLTGAVNAFGNAVTGVRLKLGEGGFAKYMAQQLNEVSAAINGIPQDKLDRLVNAFREQSAARTRTTGNIWLDGARDAYMFGHGLTGGESAANPSLYGLQSDIRDRLRNLPAYAGTADQNVALDQAKTQLRDLIGLIEQRAITTETAAKRMLDAEGKLQEALKKTSELDNRAAARKAEGEGYYRNSGEMNSVADQAHALYLKNMATEKKLAEEYTAALGVLQTARDAGVMSTQRYNEAQAELTRTTLLALNASALQVQNAKTALSQQGFQNEIDLQKQSLDTQRNQLKASLEAELTDRTVYAQRVYALDVAELNLSQQGHQLKLAALASEREAWERLEGRYLTRNEQIAKGLEFDQKELAIKGQIAVTEAKRLDVEIERRRTLLEAARAEFDLLGKIDDASKQYTDTLREQHDDQAFSLGLLGKTATQQQVLNAQHQIGKGLQAELNRLIKEENELRQQGLLTFDAAERIKAARDAAISAATAQKAWTATVIETNAAYERLSSAVDGFLDAALQGGKSLVNWFKTSFFDYLKKEVLKPLIMQVIVSATGGVSGGGASGIVGSLLGGGSGATSLIGSLLGGGTSLLSTLGLGTMPFVAGAGPIAAGTGLAGVASSLGLNGLAGGLASLGGAISGAVTSVLAAIPVFGWIALAAGAAAAIFGKRNPGFKIDNNLTNVGNPASHFTDDAISKFDISGRGTDAPEIQSMLKPFITAVQTVDDLLANKLLGADVLAKIRANMNLVNNASSWENLDKAGIEKGSMDFLKQRYGVIFDEVDAQIAATVRNFTGTSEALLAFIGSVVTVMQALQDNAAYYKAVIGETVSVGQIAALAKEGEDLTATMNRIVSVFTATNGVAALMGKDVATAFGAVGLASLEARQNLVDLAGGISQLDSMSRFYYEHFYTEAERAARNLLAAGATVSASFAELNLTVPTTRAEFRALVEAQDLTTEAGRRTWAALVRLAPAFDTITQTVDQFMETVNFTPRDGRSLGPGSVTPAGTRSQDYLDAFFTDLERQAMHLADAQGQVNEVFARFNLTVPTSRAAFRDLVEGIDQSTDYGKLLYAALMGIAGAFRDVTAEANAARDAVSVGTLLEQGASLATQRMNALFGIIDSTAESVGVKLQRKLAAATSLLGEFTGSDLVSTQARDLVRAQQAELAGNLALFTTLQAQYGGLADQMYELELWHREQITLANGSASQLLLIEQSYSARRNAILTGGVSTGLAVLHATVQDWLNKLLLNDQLSTLSPTQRLAEARRQYEAARSGSDDAAFTQAGDAYLKALRDMFASGADYLDGFNQVTADARARIGGSTVPVTTAGATDTTSTAVDTATAAATSATAAAEATKAAIEQMQAQMADLLGRLKSAVEDGTQAEISTANAVAARVVGAIEDRASARVI